MTNLRLRLSLMMFLEYAIWGAWSPVISATLTHRLNATGADIGNIFAIFTAACIITPFIGGQLVDRYMPSQVFLALAAVITAASCWMISQQQTMAGIYPWMWVMSLAFAPTIGICNSIAFHHLSHTGRSEVEQEKDFAVIRTAGTVGWIVVAFVLTWYLGMKYGNTTLPKGQWAPFEEFHVTAAAAVLLALVALFLPHTPPSRESENPWAFVKSFSLFRVVPGFAAFMIISLIASTEFQFFYVLSAPFLETLGIPHTWIPVTKSSSQIAEIVSLAVLLPLSLKYLGMKKTLVIGTLAWPLRYFIFSLGQPVWLVVTSLMFHGIGFAFVFITSQIYVDRVAPKDIRASAQSLLTLVTLGVGNLLGTKFCGWLKDHYTTFVPDPKNPTQMIPGEVNWPMVFLVPAIISLICALAYWLTFKEPKGTEPEDEPHAPLNVPDAPSPLP
jgi:nucleoside transporter